MSGAGRGTHHMSPGAGVIPSGGTVAPSGFVIEPVEYRADAPLPNAGAFTAISFATVPLGTRRVTWWIAYTGASATGSPRFQHSTRCRSSGTGSSAREVIQDQSTLATSQPDMSVDIGQEQIDGPVPGVATVQYQLTYVLPAACTGVALQIAELGDTVNPGNCEVYYTADSEM